MISILRWTVRFWLAFTFVIALAWVSALHLLDREALIRDAVAATAQETGLDITVSGPVTVEHWPWPGWRTGRVVVTGTDGDAPLAEAESALVTLWPRPLSEGDWRIGAVVLHDAALSLTRSEAGWNWPVPASLSDTPVTQLGIRHGKARLMDPAQGIDEEISLPFTLLGYPADDRGLWLWGWFGWRGQEGRVSLDLSTPRALMDGEWVYLDASFKAADDSLTARGRYRAGGIGHWPIAEGTVNANLQDPTALHNAMTGDDLPSVLAEVRGVNAEIRLETVPERFLLRSAMTGNYRETTLSGSILATAPAGWSEDGAGEFEFVNRAAGIYSAYLTGAFDPDGQIDGELSISVLDIPVLMGIAGAPAALPRPLTKTARIEAQAVGDTTAFKLADGVLTLDQSSHRADLAVAMPEDDAATVALTLVDVDLQQLFRDFGGRGLSGRGDGTLSLSLSTDGAVTGRGNLSVTDGVLDGTDLVKLADGGEPQMTGTAFRRLETSLALSEEKIDLPRVTITAGDSEMTATGGIDVRSAMVDLRVIAGAGTRLAVSGELGELNGTLVSKAPPSRAGPAQDAAQPADTNAGVPADDAAAETGIIQAGLSDTSPADTATAIPAVSAETSEDTTVEEPAVEEPATSEATDPEPDDTSIARAPDPPDGTGGTAEPDAPDTASAPQASVGQETGDAETSERDPDDAVAEIDLNDLGPGAVEQSPLPLPPKR